MPESVALYQGRANIPFTPASISTLLRLGVFDQDPMTGSGVQKTDQPGQTRAGLLIDDGQATRLGSCEFAVHVVGLKTHMVQPFTPAVQKARHTRTRRDGF